MKDPGPHQRSNGALSAPPGCRARFSGLRGRRLSWWSSGAAEGEPATRIALVRAAYGAATALGQTGREIRSDSSCSSWEQVSRPAHGTRTHSFSVLRTDAFAFWLACELARSESLRAAREGIEPPVPFGLRLTAGCLAIRRTSQSARSNASAPRVVTCTYAETVGAGTAPVTCGQVVKEREMAGAEGIEPSSRRSERRCRPSKPQ